MESSQRNLMISYAIVCFFSVVGVALNSLSLYNLKSLNDPGLGEEIANGLTKGFISIALLYFLIALLAVFALIKKRYSLKFLIVLIVVLVATFAFGPYIFDMFIGDGV